MTQKNTPMLRRARRAGVLGAAAALLAAGAAVTAAPAQAATAPANTWDKLAACESSGNWSINSGNGYSGGLQFTASTWKAYGGKGSAHNASKAEQIRVAKRVQAGQGWGAWPACSAKLGLYGSKGASDGATGSTARAKKSVATTSSRAVAQKSWTKSTRSYSAKATTKSYAPTAKRYVAAPAKPAPVKSIPVKSTLVLPKHVKDSGKDYTIKRGDTLATIAKAQGLDSWLSLYALNKSTVANPDLIFVGQKLSLPAA